MVSSAATFAILICTYDGAEDLWQPLATTYQRYWADCPAPVYLSSNHKKPDLQPFIPLAIGEEISWSDNILKCLKKIPEPYVMLSFDDLFLKQSIDTQTILPLVKRAIANDWHYLRFHPSPKGDESVDKQLSKIAKNRLYRCSTVWALFNKTTLQTLLDETESAWQFENYASRRSNQFEHFYVAKQTLIPYINGVVKGKWVPDKLAELQQLGIDIDTQARQVMSASEARKERWRKRRMQLILTLIPANLRVWLKRIFRS